MDISTLKPASETILEILHPNGSEKPIGIRVSLMSLDDERLKKIKRSFQDRLIEKQKRGKQSFTAEEVEQNRIALIKATMTGWEWYDADINGKKPIFPNDVEMVFEAYPWFQEQIELKTGDTKSFFPE